MSDYILRDQRRQTRWLANDCGEWSTTAERDKAERLCHLEAVRFSNYLRSLGYKPLIERW